RPVELRRGGVRDVLRRLRELLPQARHARALLLGIRLHALGVGPHARLDLGEHLLLALAEARDLRGEALLGALEVLRPLGEPPLEPRPGPSPRRSAALARATRGCGRARPRRRP